MTTQDQILFNDLCKVLIYHHANLRQKPGKATNRLIQAGIMTNKDDWEPVKNKYDAMLEDYAKDHLPEDWGTTYDYWGAKCFCHKPGWNAPKNNTLYAGDKNRFYMLFASFAALAEYTKEKIAEIESFQGTC